MHVAPSAMGRLGTVPAVTIRAFDRAVSSCKCETGLWADSGHVFRQSSRRGVASLVRGMMFRVCVVRPGPCQRVSPVYLLQER